MFLNHFLKTHFSLLIKRGTVDSIRNKKESNLYIADKFNCALFTETTIPSSYCL